MNAFQLATSTSNMPVGADHLANTLVARRSLARRLPVKAMSKYVAVLDATGEVYPLALLARKQLKGEAGNCLTYFLMTLLNLLMGRLTREAANQ